MREIRTSGSAGVPGGNPTRDDPVVAETTMRFIALARTLWPDEPFWLFRLQRAQSSIVDET